MLNNFDITRPGRILSRIKKQMNSADDARFAVLAKRFAVVESRVRELLDLVSMKSVSDKIN